MPHIVKINRKVDSRCNVCNAWLKTSATMSNGQEVGMDCASKMMGYIELALTDKAYAWITQCLDNSTPAFAAKKAQRLYPVLGIRVNRKDIEIWKNSTLVAKIGLTA